MDPMSIYLDHLNEDFSFIQKAFKGKLLAKIGKEVKDSVKGKSLNMSKLQKALKPIPMVSQDKINNFLVKYIPNYDHNLRVAKSFFDKKHPDKTETNERVASVAALIASANDKKSIQDTTRDLNRSYSRAGGTGGGAFIVFILGAFLMAGAFQAEFLTGGMRAMAFALGALLMVASFRSLTY